MLFFSTKYRLQSSCSVANKMSTSKTYTLKSLLATPKGNLEYCAGDNFLLHVFWEAPNISAARELLAALQECGTATHRDTPCVPTYFFRISNMDLEVSSPAPRLVSDLPQVSAAKKKLRMGVPLAVVSQELSKRGINPRLLDLELTDELPPEMQQQPVAVEFTEVYLDEQAFMEHAGSKDYLAGYGKVMNPALFFKIPQTVRLGTPPAGIVEKILEPILKEIVCPAVDGAVVWKRPTAPLNAASGTDSADSASGADSSDGDCSAGAPPLPPSGWTDAVFLSLDFDTADRDPSTVVSSLPESILTTCTTCVSFPHLLRENTTRVMVVLPSWPELTLLQAMASLGIARGEIFVSKDARDRIGELRDRLLLAELTTVSVGDTESSGFILHALAANVTSKS